MITLAACGDDDGPGGNTMVDGGGADGGPGGNNGLSGRVDDLGDQVDDLGTSVDDLGTKIDDLQDAIDMANKDLDDRIKDLEDPEDKSCSEGESCIPNGISLVNTAIADVIAKLCELEFDCCDENERNYKFGPAIPDAETCAETFTALVNSGFSPDFLESNVVGYVIDLAQALNNTGIKVAIDEEGVDECIEFLEGRECNKYEPEGEPVDPECNPDVITGADMPCSPNALVNGLQAEGEQCGVLNMPECMDGFICRKDTQACLINPNSRACLGICAKAAEAGDACTKDSECENAAADLFCNRAENECQERGGEGADCAYINIEAEAGFYPTMSPGWTPGLLQNPLAMAIECKAGLSCDPKTNTCVSRCSEGYLCSAGDGHGTGGVGGGGPGIPTIPQFFVCPEGNTCNVTENPGMRSFGLGVCRPALSDDEPCTGIGGNFHECESDRCLPDLDGYVCVPALKKQGEACTLPGPGASQLDSTCATGYCAADSATSAAGKCAIRCTGQSEGSCPDTHFCNQDVGFNGFCDAKKANGAACNPSEILQPNQNDNYRCASGFCDAGTSFCAPKVAAGAMCNQHAACPAGQFCDLVAATPVCTNHPAIGAACTIGTLPCDWGAGAACVDVDGTNQCAEVREFPLEANCATQQAYEGSSISGDALCASGWCGGGTCAEPIAEDEDCDVEVSNMNRCAAGLYCDHPADDSAGSCKPKRTVGEECNPRFRGQDCINSCEERNDRFVCNRFSLNFEEDEIAFCDG